MDSPLVGLVSSYKPWSSRGFAGLGFHRFYTLGGVAIWGALHAIHQQDKMTHIHAYLLLCFSVLLVCWYWKRWVGVRTKEDGQQIPGPPGTPLLGHLLQILRPDFHRTLTAWSEEYGGVYRISILGLAGIVVSEPGAIARVLGRDGLTQEIPKHLASYKQLNLLWGSEQQHSIFTGLSTDTWRLDGKLCLPLSALKT